jgi:hypothetical protein
MRSNGNGHAADVPRFYREDAIEGVATSFGLKIDQRVSVRFPGRCFAELEAWIVREGKTGRLSIDYSQGHGLSIQWEETR